MGEVLQRPAHDAGDAVQVDLLHGVGPHAGLVDELALVAVDAPDADENHVLGTHARLRSADTDEVRMPSAGQGGEGHPVDVARRRRLRHVEIGVGVEPDHAGATRLANDARDGPYGDRVVAAQKDGE